MRKTQFKNRLKLGALRVCTAALLLFVPALGAEQKTEDGQFNIYMAGKEIGREKFSIQTSGDLVSSSSTLTFREPGPRHRNIKIQTELSMNNSFAPVNYQLRTEVDGKKGIVKGAFGSGQATFEYVSSGSSRKAGLLVGEGCLILDTNVFHHFIFVARRFDFDNRERSQSVEVVIPQDVSIGVLKIRDVGLERISVQGKKTDLHHLKAETGSGQADLWIDDQHVLYKIVLPAGRLEAVRN